MTAGLYIAWIASVAAWLAVLIAVQRPIRQREGMRPRILAAAAKAILATATAIMVMVGPIAMPYWAICLSAALYAALFGDAAADLLALAAELLAKPEKAGRMRLQTALSIACTAAFLVYGTVNMQTVTANRFELGSDKLSQEYRFAFVADLHVGSSQSMRTTARTIASIAAEDVDFVILGGDIVDIYTTREEMEETFALFGAIDAPVYFIYGNHDRQLDRKYGPRTFTEQELVQAIRSNGIEILQDEWVSFSDELVIFGREDYSMESRREAAEIEPRPADAFVLLADHSPYETADIVSSGADLQVSGHSHAGQLFPMQWVYRLFGYDAYGFFHHGGTELYVSSGASGWAFPFRTEEGCHYEVVTLVPAA